MQPVTDAFLLNMAEVSATLIGLFFVGIFFYIESGLRRLEHVRAIVEPYLRAGTRITLIVFAIPLGLSLSLVALDLVWSRILFAVLCVTLIAANVDSLLRVGGVSRASRSPGFLVMELVTVRACSAPHRGAVGPRRSPPDTRGPHVGDPSVVRGRVPQHLRDRDVGLRHIANRGSRTARFPRRRRT
ncbi:MAG TPA: hypothetical protein VJ774_02715 [Actinomycetota bacterium]|nr:hypothetical protein [Actinomycetota bacterium]